MLTNNRVSSDKDKEYHYDWSYDPAYLDHEPPIIVYNLYRRQSAYVYYCIATCRNLSDASAIVDTLNQASSYS